VDRFSAQVLGGFALHGYCRESGAYDLQTRLQWWDYDRRADD
jgi:hypothetical protein